VAGKTAAPTVNEARGVADGAKPKRGAKAMRGKRESNELHEGGQRRTKARIPRRGARRKRGEVASLP